MHTDRTRGFTIIEVIIVLALAGLILLTVFLVVPALQRNSRNYGRKQFVNYVGAALQQYRTDAGAYPDDPTAFCSFITNYLKDRNTGMGACNPAYVAPDTCVLVSGGLYNVCYHDRDGSSHGFEGEYDEVSLQGGHWCNSDPAATGEDPAHPITSDPSSTDQDTSRFVIWTKIEGPGLKFYCIDNFANKP